MSFGKPDSMPALTRYDGVDSRPTLLRVLTDLYVQKPAHSIEEEHHYTELALRLVEVVDLATRKTVAERLVRYPAAPLAVIQRLARDIFEFAKLDLGHVPTDPQLRDAPKLAPVPPPRREPTPSPVLATANTTPTPDAAVAPVPGTLTARLFAEHRPAEPPVASATPEPVPAPAPAAPLPRLLAANGSAARATPVPPPERQLGDQFYALDAPARRLMLLRLGAASERPLAAIKPTGDACGRLEAAALGGQPDVFIGELERSLAVARAEAQRIVNDTSGEPVVVAAKALAMPLDVLQRILLFLNPAVGRSVERLYALSALYEELRPDAALRLVSAWRGSAELPVAAKTARHQPQLFDDERRSARDNATPAPRRAPAAAPAAAAERQPSPYSVGGRHRTI